MNNATNDDLPPLAIDRSIPFGAIWTSFTLTLHGLLRAKRLLALLILFVMPLLMLITFRLVHPLEQERMRTRGYNVRPAMVTKDHLHVEFTAIFLIIANAAAPLTILLFASGMIRDEQEDQTLTYLLVRPIPKWALYLSKLLAAILVAWFLTGLGIGMAMVTLWLNSAQPPAAESLSRLARMLPAFGLLLAANGAVFAALSIIAKRSLIVGAIYIALFEGFLANYPFVLRQFTNMHYFQCIIINNLGPDYKKYDTPDPRHPIMVWPLAKELVPDTQEAVLTLLGVFIVASLLGMYLFTVREFRLKTPEGN